MGTSTSFRNLPNFFREHARGARAIFHLWHEYAWMGMCKNGYKWARTRRYRHEWAWAGMNGQEMKWIWFSRNEWTRVGKIWIERAYLILSIYISKLTRIWAGMSGKDLEWVGINGKENGQEQARVGKSTQEQEREWKRTGKSTESRQEQEKARENRPFIVVCMRWQVQVLVMVGNFLSLLGRAELVPQKVTFSVSLSACPPVIISL